MPARRGAAVHGAVGLAPLLEVGPLPYAVPGLALTGALRVRRFRAGLSAAYRLPASVSLLGQAGAGGSFGLATATASLCGVLRPAGMELDLCGLADVGFLHARGAGVAAVRAVLEPWFALGAGASLRVPLARNFALRLDAALLVPVLRPSFVLENVGDVFQPAPWDVRASFGGEVTF